MVRALAVLANGGILPFPHISTSIRSANGISRRIPMPGNQRRVLKQDTVETMTGMLVTVYDKALLNGVLKQDHYSIAAKTGTAQIAIPGGGGYYADRYLHSFFGYFPAHDPRFIIFLYAVEPQKEAFASHTLARPFLDLTKFLINYYNIPPDR
jgi:cell division protein FtsI/penicillin-binding protein 2